MSMFLMTGFVLFAIAVLILMVLSFRQRLELSLPSVGFGSHPLVPSWKGMLNDRLVSTNDPGWKCLYHNLDNVRILDLFTSGGNRPKGCVYKSPGGELYIVVGSLEYPFEEYKDVIIMEATPKLVYQGFGEEALEYFKKYYFSKKEKKEKEKEEEEKEKEEEEEYYMESLTKRFVGGKLGRIRKSNVLRLRRGSKITKDQARVLYALCGDYFDVSSNLSLDQIKKLVGLLNVHVPISDKDRIQKAMKSI